ncbi:hypothetical protein FB564_0870 [Salinispora arenicola]|uniref:Uncharacterized protein n=1 Tax=Salinispora arenicola TaxID=168697 RepID=A0A542XJI8_SALAC|nr:hypothetical protein FB564_0870 [Salinispora arenicola]
MVVARAKPVVPASPATHHRRRDVARFRSGRSGSWVWYRWFIAVPMSFP